MPHSTVMDEAAVVFDSSPDIIVTSKHAFEPDGTHRLAGIAANVQTAVHNPEEECLCSECATRVRRASRPAR